ncbi:MAG TPA: DM13 domain-containing protein [Burkholderiales bacterium]|nr:DM13 domain-containing protein [Burkholderiales bacterium]
MKKLVLVATHLAALAIGFAAGVYVLPILTAPDAPSAADVKSAAGSADYTGEFRRDLAGSDLLHWGEGTVSVGRKAISLNGRVAPGPDYKLYLAPRFVDTKEAFLKVKAQSLRVGDVRTFENFIVPVPEGVDISRYDTVVVWCEAFSMFISAAKYR